jgi:hypothetical protein
VFATDFARLYVRFTEHFAHLDAVTVDSFAELFDANRIEYLHYCGGTTLERPFFPAITDDLLQLSAAYLSLPPAVTPRAVRTFGLLLSLFLYSTQPARQRSPPEAEREEERVAGQPQGKAEGTTHTAAASLPLASRPGSQSVKNRSNGDTTLEAATAPSAPPTSPYTHLSLRSVPISNSCMCQLLSGMASIVPAASTWSPDIHQCNGSSTEVESALSPSASAPPLSYTEARVVLMLHRAGAWHVEPYVREGPHVLALLAAHAACGAPLVTQVTPLPAQTFAAALTTQALLHASAPPATVGGPDSLLRDPEFVRLRLEYEKARQQLLQ